MACGDRDIEPMLTLYHWDLPQALEDRGGWTNRETSERFAEYAGIVYEALSDTVGLWITLNEPWVASWLGHAYGVHAPGETDPAKALAATHHLLLGHGLALDRLHSAGGDARVGVTLNLHPARPSRDREADGEAARRVDGQANRLTSTRSSAARTRRTPSRTTANGVSRGRRFATGTWRPSRAPWTFSASTTTSATP